MIVAIDGPSASGKSTVAKATAIRLGFGYLDTGAMYRAVALKALLTKTPLDDAAGLSALAAAAVIAFERGEGPLPTVVLLDGRDVSAEIRSPEVNHAVSPVSKVPGVRQAMVALQRAAAGEDDYVVEGRDIGTVVFPDAPVKVFLTASADERARRRLGDLREAGHAVEQEDVAKTLERRDRIDSTRETAPLARAGDAVELDTTAMSIEAVVDAIVRMVEDAR